MDRIKKVLTLISKSNLDGALISSVSNITYLTNFSGFSQYEREAYLVISENKNYLITDGRYSETVEKIRDFELLEISHSKPIGKIFETLSKKFKKLGVEENSITLSESKKLRKHFKLYPLKNIQNLRSVKDSDEISKIEKACQIGDEAFNFIISKLKSGVTEKEIAYKLEFFIKQRGAELSFPPIVAFGKNSSIPHHKTSDRKLKTDNIALLDFGVRYEDYCSDMTRTVFFGKADDKFKKIYNTVLVSQRKAIDFLISSFNHQSSTEKLVKSSLVDKVSRNHIISAGFPSIPHSLGHGIGIEVHEPPNLSPTSKVGLLPGMVFSIEPGIYLSGYGGLRIEDLVVLEKRDIRLLTHSPRTLLEI